MSKPEEAIAHDDRIVIESGQRQNGFVAEGTRSGFVGSRPWAARLDGNWLDTASPALRVFDMIAMLAAALLLFSLTFGGRNGTLPFWHQSGNGRLLLVAALLAPFCLDWAGLYANAGGRPRLLALGRVVVALAAILGLLVLVALAFVPNWPSTAQMLAEWVVLTLSLLVLGRVAVLAAGSFPAMKGVLRERVAVLGSSDVADRVASHIERRASAARLVGRFDDSGQATRRPGGPGRNPADLREMAMAGKVDRVFIALPPGKQALAAELTRSLSSYAIDVAVCAEPSSPWAADREPPVSAAPRSVADRLSMEDVPTLPVVRRPLRPWQAAIKAIEDRILGLLLLIVLSPLLLIIGAAVRLTSRGPALFKQTRHGFRNREITVYKFRTMRADAADLGGRVQTTRDDPRITAIGAFLRSSSLDELPQLVNVVRGEMSLVGPRPLPIDMRTDGLLCSEIVEDYANRHRVRPGITGWAQVNGYRGATTTCEQVSERVRLDNYYIDRWSLWFDLKIMALTLIRVFDDDNAF